MENKRFGRWTVLGIAESTYRNDGREFKKLRVVCDCGTEINVAVRGLKNGKSKSCGCLNRDIVTKHGISMERIYNVYRSMLQRCNDSNHWLYPRYGGRGITVCDEWNGNPLVFKKWAINNGYNETLTLDRIDNNKGYSPDNCRFVTKKENMNNKSNTVFLTINGEKIALMDAAKKYNIDHTVLSQRVKKLRWNHTKAVSTPVRKLKRRKIV